MLAHGIMRSTSAPASLSAVILACDVLTRSAGVQSDTWFKGGRRASFQTEHGQRVHKNASSSGNLIAWDTGGVGIPDPQLTPVMEPGSLRDVVKVGGVRMTDAVIGACSGLGRSWSGRRCGTKRSGTSTAVRRDGGSAWIAT
eukprot:3108625-Rhodomonas_salina.2